MTLCEETNAELSDRADSMFDRCIRGDRIFRSIRRSLVSESRSHRSSDLCCPCVQQDSQEKTREFIGQRAEIMAKTGEFAGKKAARNNRKPLLSQSSTGVRGVAHGGRI